MTNGQTPDSSTPMMITCCPSIALGSVDGRSGNKNRARKRGDGVLKFPDELAFTRTDGQVFSDECQG